MIIWILFLCWWLIAFLPPIYINGKWFMKNIAGLTLAPFFPFAFFDNIWAKLCNQQNKRNEPLQCVS